MDGKTLLVVIGVAIAMVAFIVFLTDNPIWQASHRANLEALHTTADDTNDRRPLPKPIASAEPSSILPKNGMSAASGPVATKPTETSQPIVPVNTAQPAATLARIEIPPKDVARSSRFPSKEGSNNKSSDEKKSTPPSTKAREFRMWTATNGYQVEGQFVSKSNDGVVLKRTDGKTMTVQLSLLSQADVEYLNGMQNGETNQPSEESDSKVRSKIDLNASPLPQKITASNVEQVANSRRTAKEALQVYETFLADDSIPDEAKITAKARFPYWQALAAKDFVRLGITNWVSRDDAQKAQDASIQLIAQAIDLLKTGKDVEARKKLETARALDPDATQASFILGLLEALKDRNYKQAKPYFVECIFRDSQDVCALNNLALLNALTNNHAEAIKNFQAALSLNSAVTEVTHNLRRILDQAKSKNITVAAAYLSSYKGLYDGLEQRDSSKLDKTGWLYMLPADLLANFSELSSSNGVSVSSQWIEDRACRFCYGTGKLTCPDCRGRGKVTVTTREFSGNNPLTGLPIYKPTKVDKDCPRCADGYIQCPNCSSGIDRTLQ